MNVLIACEFSGMVRRAFRGAGHNAWSCDLLPAEDGSRHHLQCDARAVLAMIGGGYWSMHGAIIPTRWDLMIAHPPCTRLANSGVRWLAERNLWAELDEAAAFFRAILAADVPMIAVENPIPHKYAVERIGRTYDQTFQPWHHGHREMKATCLWLKNLPPLAASEIVGPPPTDAKERLKWAKVHQASPGKDRWKVRSRTLPGVAAALADQWGSLAMVAAMKSTALGIHPR